jgi:hypothetical protein
LPYALAVGTRDGGVIVTLKADNATVTAIAADLERRLRARVVVGQQYAAAVLTADFVDAPLEAALVSMAPRAMVDYEIRRGAPPVVRAVHLLAADDPNPRIVDGEGGGPVGLMVEGDTEDSSLPAADLPLRVTGDRHALTVVARKQRLTTVASAIAEVIGAQIQLSADPPDIVDADFRERPAEEVVTRLSDKLRLLVRVDVNQSERTPLRLVIAGTGAR